MTTGSHPRLATEEFSSLQPPVVEFVSAKVAVTPSKRKPRNHAGGDRDEKPRQKVPN
jgi:hypothetical protein